MEKTEDKTEVASNTSVATVSRCWSITIYNFDEGELLKRDKPKRKWVRSQIERCPDTGRLHIQAGIYYASARSFSTMKNEFKTSHLEVAKNAKALFEYCGKEDTRVEVYFHEGDGPCQGDRSDLRQLAESIVGGGSIRDVISDAPEKFVQYHKGLQLLWNEVNLKPRVWGVRNERIWYYGLAGTNKTRSAVEKYPSYYIKDGTQWWDGYKQEECVIIDDFDGRWPYRDLLRLLDQYPYKGQYKGGYIDINSNIIITCEYSPIHFWEGNELEQIMRRLTLVEEKKKEIDWDFAM